jgi:hypothetical protein
MSLLNTFPEIDKFFKQNQFDNTELSDFLSIIERTYQNVDLRKAALNLINLEILKYDIQKEKINLRPTKKVKVSTKITITKPDYTGDLCKLKTLTIERIAESLDWTTQKLQILLKQKKIEKNNTEMLTAPDFLKVKEMFLARLTAVKRIEKKKVLENTLHVKNKKSNKSLSKVDDVYSQIYKIGLGKVIYIRKK